LVRFSSEQYLFTLQKVRIPYPCCTSDVAKDFTMPGHWVGRSKPCNTHTNAHLHMDINIVLKHNTPMLFVATINMKSSYPNLVYLCAGEIAGALLRYERQSLVGFVCFPCHLAALLPPHLLSFVAHFLSPLNTPPSHFLSFVAYFLSCHLSRSTSCLKTRHLNYHVLQLSNRHLQKSTTNYLFTRHYSIPPLNRPLSSTSVPHKFFLKEGY